MPPFGLKFNAAKSGFFDRRKVIDALDRATFRIFSQFGREVRKTAQKSLVYSEGASAPGSPPHAHKSHTIAKKSKSRGVRLRKVSFLREYIFYSLDKSTKSVVTGPVRLNSTVSSEALHALEYGGASRILDHGKPVTASIAARPFMGPAAESVIPTLPARWRDSVR